MFCFAKQKLLITSYNTAYLVTAFYKSIHPYLSPLCYGKHQICRNVTQNGARFARTDFA